MPELPAELPASVIADLLDWSRTPATDAELEGNADGPADARLIAAYQAARATPAAARAALSQLSALLPAIPPLRAALLATLCGALVEDGADPDIAFVPTLDAIDRLLAALAPYLAVEPDEESDLSTLESEEAQDIAAQRARWHAAQQALQALGPAQRRQVTEQQRAVDHWVPPAMTMLMRSRANHRHYIARAGSVQAIDDAARNGILPMDGLYYLQRAALLSYEDEVAVVLPPFRTGALFRVHAVDSTFHAFALLQRALSDHAEALKLPPPLRRALEENPEQDQARFHWMTDGAYEGGQLVNPMRWAWGEPPLRELPRRAGRVLLYADALDTGPRRSWNGFGDPLHDAQNPHVALVRLLTPAEVAAYLDTDANANANGECGEV